MNKAEAHKHFILGENKQWFPNEDFIIHMAEPRCFIRYSSELAMFSDYDTFYSSIPNVQWIDGRPIESLIKQTLINAWEFLCIEEQILEDEFGHEFPPDLFE